LTGSADNQPRPFEVERPGVGYLRGEEVGPPDATPIVLVHGLTATRRYVLQGSRLLTREGYRLISYDARGHGESDRARPGEAGYTYPELIDDLAAVVEARVGGDEHYVLAGHSMGAHTATCLALRRPPHLKALVVAGPAFMGVPLSPERRKYWDDLADGLERDGIEGFIASYDDGLDPGWRDLVLRITRERLARHRDLDAIVGALRGVTNSWPFRGLETLRNINVPTLIVGSHDEADPGHPWATAKAWAEEIPGAVFISEAEGESPLAWQGGRLSRAIAEFLSELPG